MFTCLFLSTIFDTVLAAMSHRLKAPVPLSEILSEAIKSRVISEKTCLIDLQTVWPDLVKPPLDRRAWPLKILGQRLIVAVEGASWAEELYWIRQDLLQKIQKRLPYIKISEIRHHLIEPRDTSPRPARK